MGTTGEGTGKEYQADGNRLPFVGRADAWIPVKVVQSEAETVNGVVEVAGSPRREQELSEHRSKGEGTNAMVLAPPGKCGVRQCCGRDIRDICLLQG